MREIFILNPISNNGKYYNNFIYNGKYYNNSIYNYTFPTLFSLIHYSSIPGVSFIYHKPQQMYRVDSLHSLAYPLTSALPRTGI
jgi:hypothetical protein